MRSANLQLVAAAGLGAAVLIGFMARLSSLENLPKVNSTGEIILQVAVCLFLASVFGMGVALMAIPQQLKQQADALSSKVGHQAPRDAYYLMFLRQFGAYIVFLTYLLWLEPHLAQHVWKLMALIIIIKAALVLEPPIPLNVHASECVFMAFLGGLSTLYYYQISS